MRTNQSQSPDEHAIEARLDAATQACARAGARLTPLRRDVLALVLQAEGPVTAYQLLDLLRQSRKGAVPPTIYRALEFLLAHKLIHRVESLNAFVSCTNAAQHPHAAQFLICAKCGAVAEVQDAAVAAALRDAAERHGFQPSGAVIEVNGICAACA